MELLTPVGDAVLSINAGESSRATCNALLTAVYNAKNQLPAASDPDVAKAVTLGFDNAVMAGGACLREERGLQDIYLTLAGAGFHLAQKLVDERYHLSIAVRGISDVIGGERESAITSRARTAAPAAAAQEASAPTSLNQLLRMTDAHAVVTEANDSWRRFAWRLTLQNVSSQALTFTLKVEFTNSEGYTIDKDVVYGVSLPPGGSRAMSGDTIISMPAALNVAGIRGNAE